LAVGFAVSLLPQAASAQTVPARTAKPAARSSSTAAAAPASATAAACTCPAPAAQPQHVRPYSADLKITRVQTLADGTAITTVTAGQTWRDAQGRTRQETVTTPGNIVLSRFVSIYDPVARIRMSWSIGDPNVAKVVNLQRIPQPGAQPAPANPPANPRPVERRYYPYTTESLPPQTIGGLYATGSRTTRTTPAGYEGNDHDITVTNETWTSPDLGLQLRRITDDPRSGKMTTEYTNIQQTEPDPSLFKAPDGYQVKDVTPPALLSAAPVACSCAAPAAPPHFLARISTGRYTQVESQSDGTSVTTVTPWQEWRDDAGREREERLHTLPDGTQYRDDSVYDPVALVRMAWSVGKPNTPNVVTVTPFPKPLPAPPAQSQYQPPSPQSDRRYISVRTQSLPPQTIAGFYAEGTLTTKVTLAGYQGNSPEITVTNETWTSPETGIQLRNTYTNTTGSRTVKTIAEDTSIQFTLPDPSLFKAPEGYTIQQSPPSTH
jgi:hypothetical protein